MPETVAAPTSSDPPHSATASDRERLLCRQREGRLSYNSDRGRQTVVVGYAVADGHIVMRLPDYNEIPRYAPGSEVTIEVDGDPGCPDAVQVTGIADWGRCHEPSLDRDPGAETWPDGVGTSVVCLPYTGTTHAELFGSAPTSMSAASPAVVRCGDTPPRRFDLKAFGRAIESQDTDTQLAAYADDAVLTVIDPDNPPSSPHLVSGKDAISTWLRGSCESNTVQRTARMIDGAGQIAYTVEQLNLDGTHEIATSMADISDGLITAQQTVLVWDRWD
jgi:ketosteroid isomerase-like protein